MSDDPYDIIREKNGNQPSVDGQVAVARGLVEEGIYTREDALKEAEIEELLNDLSIDLEYTLRTVLDNLCGVPFLTRFFPPGSRHVPISERRDEIIFDEIGETVREDLDALLEHLREDDSDDEDELLIATDGRGVTVREVIAESADIPPENVEEYLTGGGSKTRRERLNEAIDAIVESDHVSKRGDYGKVLFKHKAYRYHLI